MTAAKSRVRVLWLTKGLGQGGMERLLVAHAALADNERFEYFAAYTAERPHSVVKELESHGIRVVRLGEGGRAAAWPVELRKLVARERIDVVHSHSPLTGAVGRVVLPRGVPLIHTEHNRWDRFQAPTRWLNRLTYGRNAAAFAVSDDCRDSMSPMARRRTVTLIHGIDVEAVAAHTQDRARARAELGLGAETTAVMIVANFRSQKNYPLMLRVAARLRERPDVRFFSVGQGPLEAELKALHHSLGLGDFFTFLGYREDVLSVMSAADVIALSSDFEGLPVAVMEAKALGLPVVSTDVGGMSEAVTSELNGVLVARGDESALVEALTRVIEDHDLRGRFATESRKSAPQYSAMHAVSRYERVYGELTFR